MGRLFLYFHFFISGRELLLDIPALSRLASLATQYLKMPTYFCVNAYYKFQKGNSNHFSIRSDR